ncbi:hypothetical protein ACQ86D_33965 [Streptomyces galilaeus]
MIHSPQPDTPQDAIAAALDDYWITSDPSSSFNTTEAAEHVDASLTGYGYTITTAAGAARRCTCPPPSRATVTVTGLLALACLLACLACFLNGEQGWAFVAIIGAAALTNETADHLRTRRASR